MLTAMGLTGEVRALRGHLAGGRAAAMSGVLLRLPAPFPGAVGTLG